MRSRIRRLSCTCCLVAVLLFSGCGSEPEPMSVGDEARPPVRMGTVLVSPDTRELVATGFVNMASGFVELLACGPRGKTHESVFVLMAKLTDIQAGLLLLGLEHGQPMPGLGKGPPMGDRVEIMVSWDEEGRTVRHPAAACILDAKDRSVIESPDWTFNGSVVENGAFKAEVEASLVATYWDPWAIVNIGSELGSDDERILINDGIMPPTGTPVTMTFRALGTADE